ncbi:MAG: hypothetical protein Q9178_002512 [Gyalolechia marmorata]
MDSKSSIPSPWASQTAAFSRLGLIFGSGSNDPDFKGYNTKVWIYAPSASAILDMKRICNAVQPIQTQEAVAAENPWSTGPDWPSNGEIDIIEGVNLQTTNKLTLHSDPGCTINGKDCQGGTGCSVDSGIYGDSINSAGGAIYALEWTSEGMSIWG